MVSSNIPSQSSTTHLSLPDDGRAASLETGSLFFVGNATTLIRCSGFTLLTDPNFLHQGDHVHLGYGLRATRLTNPAIALEDLPPLDFVVLSHLHEDHFDRIVAQKLDKTVPILTPPDAARQLRHQGFQAVLGLDTWEQQTLTKGHAQVRLTALPGRHGPPLVAPLLPNVMGSLLEFQATPQSRPFRLYISGDTLHYPALAEIPQRFPDIDLALIHLGGTKILGILLTMDGQQGVKTLQLIAPRTAIPIHFNDYTVMKSPLGDFMKVAAQAPLETQIEYLEPGETYFFQQPVPES